MSDSFIIIIKRGVRNLWDRIPYRKEMLFFVLGVAFTFVTDAVNDGKQKNKEKQERKDNYANEYLRDLNQRYLLVYKLFAGDYEQKDFSYLIKRLDALEENNEINVKFDAAQFHRYFSEKYYDSIVVINRRINIKFNYAKHDSIELKSRIYESKPEDLKQISGIYNQIKDIENLMFDDIDKD